MQGASRTRDTRFTRTPLSTLITKERCYATLPLIKLETSGYQMEASSCANIAKRGSGQQYYFLRTKRLMIRFYIFSFLEIWKKDEKKDNDAAKMAKNNKREGKFSKIPSNFKKKRKTIEKSKVIKYTKLVFMTYTSAFCKRRTRRKNVREWNILRIYSSHIYYTKKETFANPSTFQV